MQARAYPSPRISTAILLLLSVVPGCFDLDFPTDFLSPPQRIRVELSPTRVEACHDPGSFVFHVCGCVDPDERFTVTPVAAAAVDLSFESEAPCDGYETVPGVFAAGIDHGVSERPLTITFEDAWGRLATFTAQLPPPFILLEPTDMASVARSQPLVIRWIPDSTATSLAIWVTATCGSDRIAILNGSKPDDGELIVDLGVLPPSVERCDLTATFVRSRDALSRGVEFSDPSLMLSGAPSNYRFDLYTRRDPATLHLAVLP